MIIEGCYSQLFLTEYTIKKITNKLKILGILLILYVIDN